MFEIEETTLVPTARHIVQTNFNSIMKRRSVRDDLSLKTADLVHDPSRPLERFKIPCQWVSLNRHRTGREMCGYFVHPWKLEDNPARDCDNGIRTVEHIVPDRPKRKSQGETEDFVVLTREALN